MRAILALIVNDLRLLLHDRTAAAFTFILPIVFAVLFGALFAVDTPKLAIGVVNEDDSEGNQAFVERLEAAPELDVSLLSRTEALEQVQSGDQIAAVILGDDFAENLGQLFLGGSGSVELWVGPATAVEADMVEGLLTRYFMEGFFAESSDSWQPLRIDRATLTSDDRGPRNPYQVSFPQGLIWGLIGCTASFATALANERTRGTLVRILVSPVTRAQVLAGKALSCMITSLVMTVLLIALGIAVFGLGVPNLPLFVLVGAIVSAAFTGMMLLLSLVGHSERGSSNLAWAVLVIMAMFGGGMMPLYFMPEWMQQLSNISPVKWALFAIEGVVWRDLSLVDLAPALGILVAIAVSCFVVGLRGFRTSESG